MLARQVDALDQTLTKLEALKTVGIDLDLTPHHLRRDSLRAMLDLHPRPRRSKRSPLDSGGSVLHHFFATVNSSTLSSNNSTWPNLTWSNNSSALNLTPSLLSRLFGLRNSSYQAASNPVNDRSNTSLLDLGASLVLF